MIKYLDEHGYPARIVTGIQLKYYLDLAYESYYGEIWLYNNDLRILKDEVMFRELYQQRIAGNLADKIDAVKILVHQDCEPLIFGDRQDSKLLANLRNIAELDSGRDRLSTFYFGKMSEIDIPKDLEKETASGETWVFYTHRGELDPNPGVVMVRPTRFPFDGKDLSYTVVWQQWEESALQIRLKNAFERCFKEEKYFKWIRVDSMNPFNFSLVENVSPVTSAIITKRWKEGATFIALSYGDSVDVAIIVTLPEEVIALERILGESRPTPMGVDKNRYIVFKKDNDRRPLIILLVSLSEMGGVPAAVGAWDIIDRWSPKYVILTGVAGGDPDDKNQHLGDVIVGEKIVAYERAKETDKERLIIPTTYSSGSDLLQAASRAFKKWPKEFGAVRPDRSESLSFVHRCDIASGSKLYASRKKFRDLRKYDDKIHAIEMEGDGVGYACREHPHSPQMIVVKGIMDLSDKKSRRSIKRDEWKVYASTAAVTFVRDMLLEL